MRKGETALRYKTEFAVINSGQVTVITVVTVVTILVSCMSQSVTAAIDCIDAVIRSVIGCFFTVIKQDLITYVHFTVVTAAINCRLHSCYSYINCARSPVIVTGINCAQSLQRS